MSAPTDAAIQAGARVLAGDGPATAEHHWQALAVWRAMQAHMPVIVPDGWQAVPVEATDEMRRATYDGDSWHAGYAAMLAAAPKPGGAP